MGDEEGGRRGDRQGKEVMHDAKATIGKMKKEQREGKRRRNQKEKDGEGGDGGWEGGSVVDREP